MKMNWLFLLPSLVAAAHAHSAGYTNPANPSGINIVRTDGFMIEGRFGNPAQCTYADRLFVRSDHPLYTQIFDTVLAAQTRGLPIYAYVLSCQDVAWYAVPGNTFNVVEPTGSIGIGVP